LEEVEDDAQVQSALAGAVLGHVGDPNAVGRVTREGALGVVLVPFVELAPAAASLAPVDALEAVQAHQARHPVPSDADLELILQFGVHAPSAVRAATVLEDGLDDFRQRGVGDVPR
jgi:hypothetical protein